MHGHLEEMLFSRKLRGSSQCRRLEASEMRLEGQQESEPIILRKCEKVEHFGIIIVNKFVRPPSEWFRWIPGSTDL